jgi:hypothetical protein
VDALSTAICDGVFEPLKDWRFLGLGSLVDYTEAIGAQCGRSVEFDIRENIPEPEYFKLLRTGDIGFSLMISPHPSLPPLDFAAAGLIAVTNSFKTKNAESLLRVSENFVVVEPFLSNLVEGLRTAVKSSTNVTLRQRGADNFDWEHDWRGPRCYGEVLTNKVKMWEQCRTPLW